MATPYDVLGVAPDADDATIRAALRKAAKAYHPDINGSDPEAEQKLKHVIAAYEILRDPRQRAAHDKAWRGSRRQRAYRIGSTALASALVGSACVLGLVFWHARTSGFGRTAPANARETPLPAAVAHHDLGAPLPNTKGRPADSEPEGDVGSRVRASDGLTENSALAEAVPPSQGKKTVGASRTIRLSHHLAEDRDSRDRAARVFASELRRRVSSVNVTIHPELSLKFERDQQFDALQDGSLDIAIYPLAYAAKRIPEFSLALLPGLVPNQEAAARLKGSLVHTKLQEVAEANGVHILTWWWLGGGFVGRTRSVGHTDTVARLKVRAGDGTYDVLMKAANAHPVALPSSHLHEALRSGAVDVILTSYDNFLRLRLYEHAAFATFGGKHSLWTYFSPMLISKRLWDNLSVEDREAMTAAAEVSNQYFAQAQIEAEVRAVAAFQQAGAKVSQMSSEDHDGWLALAQRTSWMQYTQGSPAAQELLLSAVRTMLMSRDAGNASAESRGPEGEVNVKQ